MIMNEDLLIRRSDAEALALMVGDHPAHSARADQLIEILQLADIVPDDTFPDDRIGLGSVVTYEDASDAERHTITLVYPYVAAAEHGMVSVLSPVGTALLGRSLGDTVEVELPNGRSRTLTVVSIDRAHAAVHERRSYA